MSIEKMNHFSLTSPASVYDEEALTALELAGRTAAKVNECVEAVNKIPETVADDVQKHIEDGDFDNQINEYAGDLENRLDNILKSTGGGSEEVVDMRYGADGVTYPNAGAAQRAQFNKSLTMRGLIDNVDALPDVDAITDAGVHLLHFSEGSTSIPAGLPFTAWEGRIAALFTIKTSYHRQILVNDQHIYTRNAGASGSWGDWSCLNEITQNGGANDSDYQSKLPDLNDAKNGFYSLHFADGSAAIPANLPWSTWCGKVAMLLTTENEYKRQLLISDKYLYTRYKGATTWSAWESVTGKETYVVDINGGGDYTSILRALKAHPTNTRLIVKTGVYDIQQEYMSVYGSTYFDAYTGYQTNDVQDRGLFLGDGVELIGEGLVRLSFSYAGSNGNVKQYFSVLNTSQNNVVKNINIEILDGSCRYIIHDDFATAGGVNVFRNLHLSGYTNLGTAIGGGFGTENSYVIEDCTFENLQQTIAIAYHNNEEAGENRLYIHGCYCDGSIVLKHYGKSTRQSIASVSGCHFTKLQLTHANQTSYPNANISVTEYSNNTDEKISGISVKIPNLFSMESDDATVIPDGTNFDTLTTPGNYKIRTWSSGCTMINSPNKNSGRLIVSYTSDHDRILQVYVANTTDPLVYIRIKDGAWRKWESIVTSDITDQLRADVDAAKNLPVTLRVMQYNIGKFNMGFNHDNVKITSEEVVAKIANYKRFFGEYKPNILGIQEFPDFIDCTDSTYATNATLFDEVFPYSSTVYYGNTLKSDLVPYESTTIILDEGQDHSQPAVKAKYRVNGKVLGVIVGAGDWRDECVAHRKAHVADAMDRLSDCDHAIICLDWNAKSQSEFNSLVADAKAAGYVVANGGYFGDIETYKEGDWYRCIDQILCKGAKIKNVIKPDVYADLASDHYPLIADITLV